MTFLAFMWCSFTHFSILACTILCAVLKVRSMYLLEVDSSTNFNGYHIFVIFIPLQLALHFQIIDIYNDKETHLSYMY